MTSKLVKKVPMENESSISVGGAISNMCMLKMFELSHSSSKKECVYITMLNMRGLLKENPFMKIVGQPWKEGEIRVEVDKYHFG